MRKTVCIVHFNTPKLTTAAVMSLRKQGYDGRVVIFENSRSWVTKEGEEVKAEPYPISNDVEIIDNTKGQLVDFDAELAKWKKDKHQGVVKGMEYGSVKHMMSVEWLLQNIEESFILADSDILLKAPIDDMFDDGFAAIGKTDRSTNVFGIPRLLPFLCFINAPLCRELGIHYFDPDRAWALMTGKVENGKHHDTGASFLIDVEKTEGARLKMVDIDQRIEHLRSGSWRNATAAVEWLNRHAALWKQTPKEKGIKAVAVCAVARQENRYICEWLEYYKQLGVKNVFLYDNHFGDEEHLKDVVQPYINSGFVKLTDVGNQPKAQSKCFDECYQQHGNDYAWMMFLDIDEFVRIEGKDISKFMERYKTGDVVLVNWRTMTDNGLTHYDPRPVQERFTEAMPKNKAVKYDFAENLHVKSIVRGGLPRISFTEKFINPHYPNAPKLNCVDAHGEPTVQGAFTKQIIHDTIWIDHYFTKTAEEWVNVKLSRGYHGETERTQRIISQSDRNFFGVNERTPEKEMILSALLFQNPKTQKIMNHIAKTPQGNDQYRLEAETGYLLKSKLSGKTYKAIDTRDLKRWEVIEDPDYVKPEPKKVEEKPSEAEGKAASKREQSQTGLNSAEREQAHQGDSLGKPKTTKRANRKGK